MVATGLYADALVLLERLYPSRLPQMPAVIGQLKLQCRGKRALGKQKWLSAMEEEQKRDLMFMRTVALTQLALQNDLLTAPFLIPSAITTAATNTSYATNTNTNTTINITTDATNTNSSNTNAIFAAAITTTTTTTTTTTAPTTTTATTTSPINIAAATTTATTTTTTTATSAITTTEVSYDALSAFFSLVESAPLDFKNKDTNSAVAFGSDFHNSLISMALDSTRDLVASFVDGRQEAQACTFLAPSVHRFARLIL
jgi:hypothetical protein